MKKRVLGIMMVLLMVSAVFTTVAFAQTEVVANADAGKAVSDRLDNGDNIVYINVMNRLSIDCDCNGNPAEPDIHDIGILASTDPVALDQASIDLIYNAEGKDALVNRIEDRNGLHVLESAEQIGLGTRSYQLERLAN